MKFEQMQKFLDGALDSIVTNDFSKQAASLLSDIQFDPMWLKRETLKFRLKHFSDEEFVLWENANYIFTCLIWDFHTTNIHDHGFAGAFKVFGESRAQYLFEKKEARINYLGYEYFNNNDICEIPKGEGLIHQIWHTSPRSISLILREKKCSGQNDYFVPFFNCNPIEKSELNISAKEAVSNWSSYSENYKINLLFNNFIFCKNDLDFTIENIDIDQIEREKLNLAISIQYKFMQLAASRYDFHINQSSVRKLDQLFLLGQSALSV